MALIQRLPAEIVYKLIEEFSHDHEYPSPCSCRMRSCEQKAVEKDQLLTNSALAVLGRTCRFFHELTARQLYRYPVVSSMAKAWHLVRTLLARPDLARHVKRLSFNNWTQADDAALPDEVVAYLTQPAKYMRIRGASKTQLTQDRVSQAVARPLLIDVLLTLCPGLENLYARFDSWSYEAFGLCTPGSLPSLTAIELYHDIKPNFRLGALVSLLRAAPNLEELRLWNIEGGAAEIPEDLVLEHVKTIRLRQCNIDAQTLGHVLAMCPNVELLTFEPPLDGPYNVFGPRELVQMVVEYGRNLRKLRIYWTNVIDEGEADYDEDDIADAMAELGGLMGIRCLFYPVPRRLLEQFIGEWGRSQPDF
ncbi:hypothetical protein QBC47DRAFT_386701 [Echria macrotheca]|uniref:Uncharacterized protein n=1 Tax=Echria macrotheca TaxID=438768 RepID=A0AAJ0BA46_9PEZI|nr:hypothetical protein QBC47DRAFT_386701 [Echria macrotheca]